ncbi:hypothetical protein CEE37_01405 [candidate division LCP-89 bacterium B3_LCP]|uniref:Uncharacterized protein n=1 Tax=candidate division LCP-89 bacterium B3_LCP TaxID=2012998 RepID=A0A532V585_UNCL8|nr:MAG: hypothetical protein CEE37_01405 [candidate division LCP-89 bacterium B3_LCP]
MTTEIGEYIVGAYLQLIKDCDVVDYNVRPPERGLKGLNEFDVLGFNFKENIVYLCEVKTHITGLHYKHCEKIKSKYNSQREYARKYLNTFDEHIYMFWSPVVPEGRLTKELRNIRGLELKINDIYTNCINQLAQVAKSRNIDIGNPFFRSLQIIQHLRGSKEF